MKFRQLISFLPVLGGICLVLLVGFGVSPRSQVSAADSNTASADGDTVAHKVEDGLPAEPPYEPKTKVELRRKLSRIQFDVTQNEATEPHHSNRYWNNKRKGRYDCIVCDRPLFASETKYKSGTGWPSFWAPLHKKSVGTKVDGLIPGFRRTEVHCGRCEAHLGHVFSDGPRPTGLRYCMNSASLKFVDEKQLAKLNAEAAKKDNDEDEK